MNLNKVFILGNLTRDPEQRTLPSGTLISSFGVATNRVWKNKTGEKQEEVQFHNIVLFGRLAEIANQYLTKGSSVLIEGRIQNRTWDAQDGTKRNKTEIVGDSMQMGPRRQGSGQDPAPQSQQNASPATAKKEELETIEYPEEDINPEEIPF